MSSLKIHWSLDLEALHLPKLVLDRLAQLLITKLGLHSKGFASLLLRFYGLLANDHDFVLKLGALV